jgi:hypothetical protein
MNPRLPNQRTVGAVLFWRGEFFRFAKNSGKGQLSAF